MDKNEVAFFVDIVLQNYRHPGRRFMCFKIHWSLCCYIVVSVGVYSEQW